MCIWRTTLQLLVHKLIPVSICTINSWEHCSPNYSRFSKNNFWLTKLNGLANRKFDNFQIQETLKNNFSFTFIQLSTNDLNFDKCTLLLSSKEGKMISRIQTLNTIFLSCCRQSFNIKHDHLVQHIPSLTHYQTTNFRLFQTERVCRRQFQIWRKWKKVILTGRKHCGKRRN